MTIQRCDTPLLEVAYLSGGPPDRPPVLLLHGWPDDPSTFDEIVPALHEAGYRSLRPWLRGFGPTRFRSRETLRSGEIAAMAQDAIDLADALGLDRFAVVGHDWGARIAYQLALLFPQLIHACAALSAGWEPGVMATPGLEQAQAFWYQWFLATERGAAALRSGGKSFARYQWQHWGPSGWFDEARFEKAAESFDNPDWAEVTIHSYRVRWGEADPDPRYAPLHARLMSLRTISIPTLTIHGADDRCVLPATSSNRESLFSATYQRLTLAGVGHFPTREAAQAVNPLLLDFLRRSEAAG